jgi:hypothetical protein
MRQLVETLRSGRWLTLARVVFYPLVASGLLLITVAFVVVSALAAPELKVQPMHTDFVAFWSAGALALQGEAAAAYEPARLAAEQAELVRGAAIGHYPWFYPPVFLGCVAALALLPYGWSLFAWLTATGAAYFFSVRRIVPDPRAWLVALGFPCVLLNVGHGQNGFLSAALLGAGLLGLERHPLRSGALLGLLSYKPQLAVLVPFALAAGGQWRAFAGMALAGLASIAVSVAAFGTAAWWAFLAMSSQTQGALDAGGARLLKMVTPFSAVHWWGGAPALAWAVQGAVSLVLLGIVVWAWRRPGPLGVKAALLAAAIPLATPYAFDYDLMVLAVAIAFLAAAGLRDGFRPWELTVLGAAWLAPALSRPAAFGLGIPLALLAAAGLMWLAARRLRDG